MWYRQYSVFISPVYGPRVPMGVFNMPVHIPINRKIQLIKETLDRDEAEGSRYALIPENSWEWKE